MEDLEAPKRQTSLDGESIKIVIHDVDSGQLTTASKRRVILRRDPNEKAHRSILFTHTQKIVNIKKNLANFSARIWDESCRRKNWSRWKTFCGNY